MRGATHTPATPPARPVCFNSRTHEGCDACYCHISNGKGVSIHAPMRGATRGRYHNRYKTEFQFTHPRGVRPLAPSTSSVTLVVSIHAPARGATIVRDSRLGCSLCFNSRTREGCDHAFAVLLVRLDGFNSRTREGCDTPIRAGSSQSSSFNSRTREGCDATTISRPLL